MDSVLVNLMTSTLADAPLFRLSIEPKRNERLETAIANHGR